MKTNKISYDYRNSRSQQTKTDTKSQRHLDKTWNLSIKDFDFFCYEVICPKFTLKINWYNAVILWAKKVNWTHAKKHKNSPFLQKFNYNRNSKTKWHNYKCQYQHFIGHKFHYQHGKVTGFAGKKKVVGNRESRKQEEESWQRQCRAQRGAELHSVLVWSIFKTCWIYK